MKLVIALNKNLSRHSGEQSQAIHGGVIVNTTQIWIIDVINKTIKS